jgi:dihydrofolate synthase/folylpolyglutamate synthase
MRLGLSQAKLPGRVELVAGEPTIVLDTAHNPASAQALVDSLSELPPPTRRTLILSISHDKDVLAVVRELAPHFQRIVVTQYQENPRAVPAERLAEIVRGEVNPASIEVLTCPTPCEAWQVATASANAGECICIAGSFYLAAEMRPLVLRTHAAEAAESID